MTRLEMLWQRRDMYLEAEAAILTGQEYRNGTFSVRRADLEFVQAGLKALDREISALESNGGKRYAFQVIPRDI